MQRAHDTDTSQAIILNRTTVYASARRPIYLRWYIRMGLRIVPIWLFCSQISSLLQAIHCQTSPEYSSLKYGSNATQRDLDFSGDAGLLHGLSSVLLLWQSDQESCVAAGMIRETELSPPSVGSLSLLWPLFKVLCLSQWVDTASAALQGFKPLTETGMSIFEHSLAFAESEALISSQLGLSPWGFPKTNIAKNATATASTNAQNDLVPISALYNRMNTAPEVLLIGLISSLNCLTTHILGILGLQGRYRLLNTSVWGLCFMMSFFWGFLSFKADSGFDAIVLRFPTVCIVGFIPHLLILVGILICACIYTLALFLVVLSPNPGGPESPTLQERIQAAHDNLQAHGQMQNFQIRLHDDFYSTLLRIGFSVLTVASEAVYLNEGQKIGVGALTWLENERLKELEEAKQSFSNTLSSGVADGVTLTEDSISQSPRDARVWTSGYGRERTTKLLKAGSYTYATRTGADGVGAFQRGGRYIMVWEFFNGIFWLSMAWFATVLSKTLFPIGINWRPRWATRPSSQVAGPVKLQSHTEQPGSLEFWILSDDGHLSLPKDNDVDVEGETKKRLKVVSDLWGEQEERKLDNTLYEWWKNGGWWGEKDESGTYQQLDFHDEDTTSVISMSTNHDTASEWESEDDGSRTPTQLRPSDQTPPSPGLPMDHAIDPSYHAQLLDPKNSEQRQEARMLAAHLTSDRILTRSQYQHDQKFEKAHVLTSTRHRPPGFIPSSPNGRLTPQEEAEVLEYLIISRRAAAANSAKQGASWRDGAEGLGAGGPQCVVCQSAPRTVLSWPCRCLSLCEDCRVSLAMNNFGTCVCCRTDVVGFSRLYVP